jgi:hypothetical protein
VKKRITTLAFALVSFAVVPGTVSVWADASPTGCVSSGGQAAGCASSAPEPSSLAMLAVGLIAVAALGYFGRKKFANHAK